MFSIKIHKESAQNAYFFRHASKMHQKCMKSATWRLQEAPKTPPGRPKTDFGSVLGPNLEPCWPLFRPKTAPGAPGCLHRAFLGMSWRVLEASWGFLAASWRRRGASWQPRANKRPNKTDLGGLLGLSWPHFWEVFGWFSMNFWLMFIYFFGRFLVDFLILFLSIFDGFVAGFKQDFSKI